MTDRNPTIQYLLSDEALMDDLERTGAAPAHAFDLVDSMDGQLRETVSNIIEQVRELDQAELIHGFVSAHTNYPRILAALASSPDVEVRTGVAKVITAQPAFLRRLAIDDAPAVRRAVAENEGAPVDALTAFISDTDVTVVRAVAGNPSTPDHVLEDLYRSRKFDRELAGNPSTPADVLHRIVDANTGAPAGEPDVTPILVIVASNPNLSVYTLRLLAQDDDEDVRHTVAKNESAPLSVIRVLEKDRSTVVAEAARNVLES